MASIIKADIWQTTAGVQVSTVLNVTQGVKTDATTYSGIATYWDLVTVNVTPASASSRFLLLASSEYSYGTAGAQYEWSFFLARNGTAIGLGTGAGSRETSLWQPIAPLAPEYMMANGSGSYLDSPATMAPITYALRLRSHQTPLHINRSNTDTDGAGYSKRGITTLTVIEVAR